MFIRSETTTGGMRHLLLIWGFTGTNKVNDFSLVFYQAAGSKTCSSLSVSRGRGGSRKLWEASRIDFHLSWCLAGSMVLSDRQSTSWGTVFPCVVLISVNRAWSYRYLLSDHNVFLYLLAWVQDTGVIGIRKLANKKKGVTFLRLFEGELWEI